ncbi:MAG: peroxiredoxin family protein [Rhodospirillales bacterium]
MRVGCLALALLVSSALAPAQMRRAPGFSLPSSANRQEDLADYRGRFVLIDLMKTDCPHCGTFAKVLERVKTKYGNRITVLSIAPAPDNPETAAKFIAANKITFPILFDCGQVVYSYVRTPSVSLPRLYIVNPEGFIAKEYVYGPETQEIFEGNGLFTELDRLLGAAKAR